MVAALALALAALLRPVTAAHDLPSFLFILADVSLVPPQQGPHSCCHPMI